MFWLEHGGSSRRTVATTSAITLDVILPKLSPSKACFQPTPLFVSLGMYGPPTTRPPNAIVLRRHWQYHIKRYGTRRSRNCCDGSPTAAPMLHALAKTYSSCVDQPIQRLFFDLAPKFNLRVYGGDAKDAFAHSPPPAMPTFVAIDDAYADWYEARHNIKLDRSLVLSVQ
jgi:hypothetical protein